MTQKVSKSSIKPSLFKLRRLVLAIVFLFVAHGVWGQTTYIWTGADVNDNNWSTPGNWRTVNIDEYGNVTNVENPATSVPGSNAGDVAYIIDNSSITLTAYTSINTLRIANYADPAAAATLNLGTYTLSIGTLDLGTGNNATTDNILSMRGDLSLSNGTVTVETFDECDNGQNTLELNTVTFSITGTVWGNGSGKTTITGTGSTFDLTGLSGNFDAGEVFSFGSGITVKADKTFWTGRESSDWTNSANWSTGVPIAGSEVVIPANTTYPAILNTETPTLKSLIIQSATVGGVLKTGTLTLNGLGILNTGTIENSGEIILSGGTITASTSFTNNKTVTITSGTITNDTVSNGDNSTVIYNGTGTQSPIWGNSYQNLEIAAGTSISLGAANIAGDATNNGTLTITDNNFSVTGSKINGGSSTIIYDGVTQARWGDSYQNLEIAAGTTISIGAASIAGDATNYGTLTITDNNFNVTGSKINGGSSKIIYSGNGVTSAPWGTAYQNLEIAAGTSISLGATDIDGDITNNGTLTLTNNSFTVDGDTINGTNSTIVYDGATTPVWGNSYENLVIAAGTSISLGAVNIARNATNNGTLTITSDSFTAETKTNGSNSKIIYAGDQTANWGTGYEKLEVSSGTVSFTTITSSKEITIDSGAIANISDAVEFGTETKLLGAGTLNINNNATINCPIGASTTERFGTLKVTGTATLNNTIYATSLDFTSISIAGDTTIDSTTITGINITSVTGSPELTITSTNNIPVSGIAGSAQITFDGPVVFSGTPSISATSFKVNGSIKNSAGVTTTLTCDVELTGDFTDSGTWNQSSNKIIFSGNETQRFTPNAPQASPYNEIEINKEGGSETEKLKKGRTLKLKK